MKNVTFLKNTPESIWQQFTQKLKNKRITVAALVWTEDEDSFTCCITPLTHKSRDIDTLRILLDDCKYALTEFKFGELENEND